jgi:Rrf2 family protein
MKISTKCRYGLRAMIYLGTRYKGALAKRSDIAKDEGIPKQYLENILLILRKSGLISTARGANGGFALAKPPEQIRISEIVGLLEGSVAPVHCVLNPENCNKARDCRANLLWNKLYLAEKQILESMTLQDLLPPRRNEWVI